MSPEEVLSLFDKTFTPIGDAAEKIGYCGQYSRRLILDTGTEERDYFYVHGRIFVTNRFLDVLRNGGSQKGAK